VEFFFFELKLPQLDAGIFVFILDHVIPLFAYLRYIRLSLSFICVFSSYVLLSSFIRVVSGSTTVPVGPVLAAVFFNFYLGIGTLVQLAALFCFKAAFF